MLKLTESRCSSNLRCKETYLRPTRPHSWIGAMIAISSMQRSRFRVLRAPRPHMDAATVCYSRVGGKMRRLIEVVDSSWRSRGRNSAFIGPFLSFRQPRTHAPTSLHVCCYALLTEEKSDRCCCP